MTLALRYAARSDVGLQRDGNEDAGYAGPCLLVVADGMGGHVAGEVASSAAVAALAALEDAGSDGDLLGQLAAAVRDANAQLRDMVTRDPSLDGMGTTLTVVLRAGSRLGLAHVGDSRCYLLRDGQLEQITRDHTFVQALVDEGRISAEQAEHHPQRNLMTRALDGGADVEPDLSVREAVVGDRYLLCSDGLTNVVDRDAIASTLAGTPEPRAACEALIELALRAGAPDNVTAVVADVVELGDGAPGRPQPVGAAEHDARLPGVLPPAETTKPLPAQAAPATDPAVDGAATSGRRGSGASRLDRTNDGDRAGRPRGWARWSTPLVVVSAVLLALLAGGLYAGWSWSRQQYYVAADGGAVAIYRGLSSRVGGRPLSTVVERQDVQLATLPGRSRQRLDGTINASTLDEARRIVGDLEAEALACGARATAAAAPPAASASASAPGPGASGATAAGPVAVGPAAATPTPTPTPPPTLTAAPASPAPTPSPALLPDDCQDIPL